MGKKTIQKEEQINKLALKAGILYIVAELITRGISFLTTPIFTRLLPTDVFAQVKLYESWVYLIAPILCVSVYQSIPRAKFDFESKYKKYISSILFMMIIITIVVCLVTLPFVEKLSNILGFTGSLIIFMIIYCYAYNALQCLQAHARQMMLYKQNMMLTFLSVVPSVLTSVFFVVIYRGEVSNSELLNIRIVSFFLPTTILGIVLSMFLIVKEKQLFNFEYWKYGIKYSAPMMVFALSTQVLFQSDKIMVKALCGIEQTAIVALAATVGYIMDILAHAVDNAWRPWLFEKLNLEDYKSIRYVWKQLLIIMALITWCMIMLAPELVVFLGGKKYRAAIWLIVPIMCGSFANFIGIGYTAIEQFYKKTKCSGYASAITAMINLLLNFIFISKFGYIASAYTTAVSYLLSAIIHGEFVKSFEKKDVLKKNNTLMLWILTVSICLISMCFYNFQFILRFLIIIVAFMVFAIIYRKDINKLMIIIKNK